MHRSNRSQVAIVVLILGLSLVRPLHASDELTDLLELSGERVGRFWSELARVVCTEQVSQLRLNPKGDLRIFDRNGAHGKQVEGRGIAV